MPMSNYYSQADMRASADFGQSLYTTPDSIRMEIALNMVSAPPVASSAFHSASPIYSWVEESSANGPTSSTNWSDIDKGSNTELTNEDLPVECMQELKAWHIKLEEDFMAHYDVANQGFISMGLLGFLIRQVSKKSNQTYPRMNFNQLVDEAFAKA
jgi:hypothetical protein